MKLNELKSEILKNLNEAEYYLNVSQPKKENSFLNKHKEKLRKGEWIK